MSFLHSVPEMRQWQRATVQARLARLAGPSASRSTRLRTNRPPPRGAQRGGRREEEAESRANVGKRGDPRRGGERGSPYGPAPGGQSGSVTQEILRAVGQSYQSHHAM